MASGVDVRGYYSRRTGRTVNATAGGEQGAARYRAAGLT